jgi:undecaprenyl-diphosphatase
LRPWATLAGAVTLTSFVAVERVRSGAHFPTDVIAGAFAGAGIGMLVVHLHRYDSETRRPVWVGALPVEGGGGVMVGGRF